MNIEEKKKQLSDLLTRYSQITPIAQNSDEYKKLKTQISIIKYDILIEEKKQQLAMLKMEYCKLKNNSRNKDEYREIAQKISKLERFLAFEEEKQKFNALMKQYSVLRNNPENRAECKNVQSEATNIILSKQWFEILKNKVKQKLNGRYTIRGLDEFVIDTFLNCCNKYDSSKSNSFYAFFLHYLEKYSTTNMTRSEHIESDIDISNEDDENITLTEFAENLEINVEEQLEARLRFCEYLSKITPCLIGVGMHTKNTQISASCVYFCTFATGYYIWMAKADAHNLVKEIKETLTFDKMDVEFINWTHAEKCYTLDMIRDTGCKTYRELEIDDRNIESELAVPFERKIYGKYFKISQPSLQPHWEKFHNFLGVPLEKKQSGRKKREV